MEEIKVPSDEALKEIEHECSTEDAIVWYLTWYAEGCYVWCEVLDIEELKGKLKLTSTYFLWNSLLPLSWQLKLLFSSYLLTFYKNIKLETNFLFCLVLKQDLALSLAHLGQSL